MSELIDTAILVVPWPVAYETLRTRFVRRPEWVAALNDRLSKPSVVFIDDAEYCREAYEQTVESSFRHKRDLSMVDMVCRMLIDDPKVNIEYLITTNRKDFQDVCARNNVDI